jgi:hypothetical protein
MQRPKTVAMKVMDFDSSDLPKICFKRARNPKMEKTSMDGRMLRVLLALDGRKTVQQIASETGLAIIHFREILAKLWKLGLVECVDTSGPLVDQAFFDSLGTALIQLVGPIGEVLLEDVLSDMGLTKAKIPVSRIGDLIDRLTEQIPDPAMGNKFRQAMVKRIMER